MELPKLINVPRCSIAVLAFAGTLLLFVSIQHPSVPTYFAPAAAAPDALSSPLISQSVYAQCSPSYLSRVIQQSHCLTIHEWRSCFLHIARAAVNDHHADSWLSSLVVVGMTGSVKGGERMPGIINSWLTGMTHRAIFWSDEDQPEWRSFTLPPLHKQVTYQDAQHRQLRGIQWLYGTDSQLASYYIQDSHASQLREQATRSRLTAHTSPSIEWLLLVDDDTFVNVAYLESLIRENSWLATASPAIPIAFCFVFDRSTIPDLTYCGGGSGQLWNGAAAKLVAENIYSPLCPFDQLNDITLGRCMTALNITLIHSNDFHINNEDFNEGRTSALTYHYTSSENMQMYHQRIMERSAVLKQTAH